MCQNERNYTIQYVHTYVGKEILESTGRLPTIPVGCNIKI